MALFRRVARLPSRERVYVEKVSCGVSKSTSAGQVSGQSMGIVISYFEDCFIESLLDDFSFITGFGIVL